MLLDGFGEGAIRALAGGGLLLFPFVVVEVDADLFPDAADEYDKIPGVLGTVNDVFGCGAFPSNKNFYIH